MSRRYSEVPFEAYEKEITLVPLLPVYHSTVTDSFQDLYMIGIAYLVTGGAFALAAIMGISLKCYTVLNKRQKKCKQGLVVVFIVTIVVTVSREWLPSFIKYAFICGTNGLQLILMAIDIQCNYNLCHKHHLLAEHNQNSNQCIS